MKKILSLSVLALSASVVSAGNLNLKGQVDVNIPIQDQSGTHNRLTFKLPTFNVSPEMKGKMKMRLRNYPASVAPAHTRKTAIELPPKISLGMEGTPVLDQGQHGSCVTFAVSAAINAALGAGDYVSQLCSLELGSYLALNDEAYFSGWNGSFGELVLDQFMKYGVVSKNHQKYHSCAGVTDYPLDDWASEGKPMDKTDYAKASIPVKGLLQWDVLMSAIDDEMPLQDPVWAAKEALAKGHRLSFGTLLDVEQGVAGAVGTYKVANDTWMINPDIIADAVYGKVEAGHEMVIIGYDDNAVITDENGFQNHGVFTLRNSWSNQTGDHGNWYMSYDHFMIFAMEMHAVYLKK